MSRQIQIRRGTAAENDGFTGAIGEITMDTTNNTLRVHDGTTTGGIALAKQSDLPDLDSIDYVVESQLPTVENNYTWYRKYKSGWVEQGGLYSSQNTNIILPVEFANNKYNVTLGFCTTSSNGCPYNALSYTNLTTTGFTIINAGTISGTWYVAGLCQ